MPMNLNEPDRKALGELGMRFVLTERGGIIRESQGKLCGREEQTSNLLVVMGQAPSIG